MKSGVLNKVNTEAYDELAAVLSAREKRFNRKLALATGYKTCVISIGINLPYPERKQSKYRFLLTECIKTLSPALTRAGAEVLRSYFECSEDGIFYISSVSGDAFALKSLCISIEEEHMLGRLFDIDVMNEKGIQIKRSDLDFPTRPCIVCGCEVWECVRLEKHDHSQVMEAANMLIKKYKLKNK